jgi:predicted RNase H-like nuclease (RuvC/YqgF family)
MITLSTIASYITKKVALVSSAALMIVSLYFYIAYLRSTIDTLELQNANLIVAIQQQEETIKALKEDYTKIIASKDAINQKVKDLQKSNDDLREKLFREYSGKTSLEDLILMDKKGRVIKLINNATKQVFRCFEIITGSPLKPGEKDC